MIGLRDGITFQGDSVAEIVRAFHDSVDDYLEFCAERGESPEKPYSGRFVLRIDPRLHRAMAHAAEERGVSLNSLVEEKLTSAFSPEGRAEAEPFPPGEDQFVEGARPVGGGGRGTKRATGQMKHPASSGEAPSRRYPRPAVSVTKGVPSRPVPAKREAPSESGEERKAPVKRKVAKGRRG